MNRIKSIHIILICAVLLGVGVVWYIQIRPKPITKDAPPSGIESLSTSSNVSNEDIKKGKLLKIEKILNDVPFREIKTTKQEYETLGWNRYENKEIGFEIYYPSDWRVSESKGGNTSGEPPYMSISFAPKTIVVDFAFGLYVYKEPLKERLLTLANREWLPIEKLRVNNADAVVIGQYSEKDKGKFKDILFGSDNWVIGFVGEPNNPSVYERMFKSFRLINEK